MLIHEAVVELHEALAGAGGGAWFIMDDGYAAGPPDLVLPAIRRFAQRMDELGLVLQFAKCSYYSPSPLPSSAAAEVVSLGIQPGGIQSEPTAGSDLPAALLHGITVGGIPLGTSTDFVQAYTSRLAASFESRELHPTHRRSAPADLPLWCVVLPVQCGADPIGLLVAASATSGHA